MLYKTDLTDNEIKRYSRQIILPEIRPAGQIALRTARVLIVGLGGLGSPVLMYLASAGVGTIGVADYDETEVHNLQRQVLYAEKDLHMRKSRAAYKFTTSLNSSIKIVEHTELVNEENAPKLIMNYDVVVDCTDNISTRYVLSDCCKMDRKDLVLASVLRWEGQVYVLPNEGPCYRCLFPEIKEIVVGCDEAGVVGPICGHVGSIQASEVLKLILRRNKGSKNNIESRMNIKTNNTKKNTEVVNSDSYNVSEKEQKSAVSKDDKKIQDSLIDGRLTVIDGLNLSINTFELRKRGDCKICDERVFQTKTAETKPKAPPRIEFLDSKYKVPWKTYLDEKDKYTLIDIRPAVWYEICKIEGSVNVPKTSIEKDIKIMDKYKGCKIILLCNKGISAGKIANLLLKEGFDCFVVEGGLKKFKNEVDKSFPLD